MLSPAASRLHPMLGSRPGQGWAWASKIIRARGQSRNPPRPLPVWEAMANWSKLAGGADYSRSLVGFPVGLLPATGAMGAIGSIAIERLTRNRVSTIDAAKTESRLAEVVLTGSITARSARVSRPLAPFHNDS